MDLDQIRQKIDDIDGALVSLLEERMALVEEAYDYKEANDLPILDQSREQAVLEGIAYKVSNKDYEATLLAIFSDIMLRSRQYQETHLDTSNK